MNNSMDALASFVPAVLQLCGGDPDQVRKLADMTLAAIAQKSEASSPASPPPIAFPYSQADAARIVCGKLGLDVQTFRKNQPWLLLKKKHLGEGVGFTSRPTKNRRGVTRDYSQTAIDFLMKQENWDITRYAID